MANGTMSLPTGYAQPRANDRLKDKSNNWFWGSLLAATVIHFGVIALFPEMTTEDMSFTSTELEQIEVIQEFEIPPPPEQIQRPAVPVLSANVNIADDITIGAVTFDDNPVSNLPPPPTATGQVATGDAPTFTPFEVAPQLRNRGAYQQALERRYPAILRSAGIGGTVLLWVYINESGGVENTRIVETSGNTQLDQIAESVMREVAEFSPAQNRDQRVPVWVQIPVTFQTS